MNWRELPYRTLPHIVVRDGVAENALRNPNYAHNRNSNYAHNRNLNDWRESRFYPNALYITYEGSKLKVKIEFWNYRPHDLKVEIHGNYLVINARHGERNEKGCFVSREYRRRIRLSVSPILEKVTCEWSQYKWLTIYIPFIYSPDTFGLPEDDEPPLNPMRSVPIRIVEA